MKVYLLTHTAMNVKLPVLTGFSLGLAAFMSAAQPALADVSIEIISRSGSVRGANPGNEIGINAPSFQPTASENEPDRQDRVQPGSQISVDAEQDTAEPTDDEFEGILIRI